MNTERDVLDALLGSKARCRTERVVSTPALCEKRGKEKNISICFYVHKDMPGGRLPCKSAALLVTCDGGSRAETGRESGTGDSSLRTYWYSKRSNYKNVLNLN